MKMIDRCVYTLAALAALLLAADSATAQTSLRWKFKAGETIKQRMTQDMEMSVAGLAAGSTKVKQIMTMSWKVNEVTDGVAEITQKISRIRMSMSGPMGVGFEFDSASEEEPQGLAASFAPALKAMTKASFSVKMNSKGEALKVEVPDEVLKELQRLGPAASMFSKEKMEQMVRESSPSFPETPVQKGESWKRSYEMKMPPIGKVVVVQDMEYQGPETVDGKPLEKIGVDVKMEFAGAGGGGPEIELSEQDASGVIYFNNEEGHIHSSELKQNMTMKISVGAQQFEQQIKQSVKVEFLPEEKSPGEK